MLKEAMILLKLFFIFHSAFAEQTVRIDNNTVEDFTPFKHKLELIIEENCAYCMSQIQIFKECMDDKDVVIILDNRNKKTEEDLKKVLRKKKITYQTMLLTKSLTEAYAYNDITPTLWITKDGVSKTYSGVASCEFLKKNI